MFFNKKIETKNEYVIPIFVPHLGCRFKCTFCDQRTISGEHNRVRAKDVKETIEYYLSNFKDKDRYVEVAFFGGSFTAIDESIQNELLEAVQEYIEDGRVNSIRCSTRPDAITKDILKRLKKYHVKVIELGVQSSNDYILKKCKRGHTFEDVEKASKLIKKAHILLGHQVMCGLPEATEKDDIRTAKDSVRLKPDMCRIYPVLVIKGTELEEEYNAGTYKPLTVKQAVERAKEMIKIYRKNNVNVIRVGLQNTDVISEIGEEKSDVVSGPFHPAFGQLVEDEIWLEKIENEIKKINSKVLKIRIEANKENINNIVGHKKENLNRLRDTYALSDIIVKENKEMKKDKFKVIVLEKA